SIAYATGPDSNRLTSARAHDVRHAARLCRCASVRLRRIADQADALGAGLRNPRLPLATEQLAHVGIGPIARKAFERFGVGIEAYDRVCRPLGEPDLVIRIHPHGIGARLLAWQLPLLPALGGRIEHAHIARV